MAKKKNNLLTKIEHETGSRYKKTSQSKRRPKFSSMNKSKKEHLKRQIEVANQPLNKIIRETKGNKKFKVFVKDGDKIKTVRFGDANMSIKRDDPQRRKAFFDRMNPILAKVKGNKKLSPVYWSLRSWKLGTKIT